MKTPAGILTLLMLLFIAQPVLVQCQVQVKQTGAKAACCKKSVPQKDAHKKSPVKDCNRSATCNPFAACSGCQYTATAKFIYPVLIPASAADKIISATENIPSGYSVDFWQPPEFVSW